MAVRTVTTNGANVAKHAKKSVCTSFSPVKKILFSHCSKKAGQEGKKLRTRLFQLRYRSFNNEHAAQSFAIKTDAKWQNTTKINDFIGINVFGTFRRTEKSVPRFVGKLNQTATHSVILLYFRVRLLALIETKKKKESPNRKWQNCV